ncbi:prefoldin subunit 4-like [Sycon ciliatum]|uniref:prefoldin subunit 4-like n=1 Tax=Sycon ciliatum TaxID=27933 RepID=UPI0031F66A9C
MASKSKLKGKNDMTMVDQKKINDFANANALFQDVKEEIKTKEKEMQDLSDASDDVLMLDEGVNVPYKLGEAFICVDQDSAQEMMESAKANAEKRLADLRAQQVELQATMAELKKDLYGKFGDNINLESDD